MYNVPLDSAYFPSLIEFGVSIGVIAFATLLVLVGLGYLNLGYAKVRLEKPINV